MFRSALTALTGAVLAVPAVAQTNGFEPPKTVILVRYAEQQDRGRNPDLTIRGRQRARTLAHVLGGLEVDAIYTTQYRRTRSTAEPLGEVLAVEVTAMNFNRGYIYNLIDKIRDDHEPGEVIVVVSHTTAVPALIQSLGVVPTPMLDGNDHDDLFIVTLDSQGHSTMLRLQYGRIR